MEKPKIRFKGYQEDWEQRKLGDVADVTKLAGFEFTEHVVYSDEGNIIALRGLNIKNGQLILDDVKYIDGSNFSKLSRSKLFIDDIMFTYVGTVGEVAIIKENDRFYLAPNVSRIRVKSDDSPKFISHYMRTDNFKNKIIFPLIATSSQPALSMENIRKFTINIPINKEEQDCLAKYFDSLDHLITLHQRKCEEMKTLKKYMLQKMFPQNGQLVPQIRFSGFTEDWEQRKVSELCSISTGKSNTQDKVEDGEYPFYVRSPIIERSTKYLYDEEAVITVGDGVGTGKVFHYVNGKYDLHQRCYRMYGFSDELNAHYFYHTFSKLFYKRVMAMTAKTSVDSVRLEMISDMKIPVPNVEEQRKIGNLLDGIDHLITLHQRKCEEMKTLKKYMLQKMFPQNGQLVPQIRFSGFTEDWEQRKVTELLKNSSSAMKIGPFGSALKKEYFVEEGIKVYAQENAFTGDFSMGDYYITEDKYKELKSCELYPGDLVISMMGTIGACAIFPKNAEKGIMNSHLLRLQFNNEVIPEYIMYLLRDSVLIRKQIDRLSVGSIMSGLSSSVVKKLVFPIPKLAEQKRIVEYLDSIDRLITLHQQKCDELRNIKKFMLQNMFI